MTNDHECQFPEEETPEGVRILYPCLGCGRCPADAILELSAMLQETSDARNTTIDSGRGPVRSVGDIRNPERPEIVGPSRSASPTLTEGWQPIETAPKEDMWPVTDQPTDADASSEERGDRCTPGLGHVMRFGDAQCVCGEQKFFTVNDLGISAKQEGCSASLLTADEQDARVKFEKFSKETLILMVVDLEHAAALARREETPAETAHLRASHGSPLPSGEQK